VSSYFVLQDKVNCTIVVNSGTSSIAGFYSPATHQSVTEVCGVSQEAVGIKDTHFFLHLKYRTLPFTKRSKPENVGNTNIECAALTWINMSLSVRVYVQMHPYPAVIVAATFTDGSSSVKLRTKYPSFSSLVSTPAKYALPSSTLSASTNAMTRAVVQILQIYRVSAHWKVKSKTK
jgi:hypothetical protein